MKSNDLNKRGEVRAAMQAAIKAGDTEAFYNAYEQMCDCIAEELSQRYEERIEDIRQSEDVSILAARGQRQQTSEEREYFQAVLTAMRADDPKQALANLDKVLPTTTINAVFDDLRKDHPLLEKIDFRAVPGPVKLVVDAAGNQTAVWGELCDDIVKELSGGFEVVDAALFKLSAFMYVCKPGMELGPDWLDQYVREVLEEALANGLEAGIVDGTGNKQPIGMTRQVGEGVSVVGGVYPRKSAIAVDALDIATIGRLIGMMAVDGAGRTRRARNIIIVCNESDYFTKVMPAVTIMAPDGTYRNALPYAIEVIPTIGIEQGLAVIGLADRYFAAAGLRGRIEADDSYKFVEDKRTYVAKAYANGMPKDNNAFLLLNVAGLQPARYVVTAVDPVTPSAVATLSELKIGALALTPTFSAAEDEYTAATTNATNTINVRPTNAGATVAITVNDEPVENGSAITWESGANDVEITVTAANGTTTGTYTVTVTKS